MVDTPHAITNGQLELNDAARSQGIADANERYKLMGGRQCALEDLIRFAREALSSYDTVSGRTGDVRRSYADGYRTGVKDHLHFHELQLAKEARNA